MRDLKADLEICEAAPKGPYKQGCHEAMPYSYETQLIGYRDENDGKQHPYVMAEANYHFKEETIKLIAFLAAAREGWPEAIIRALEAEELYSLQTDDLISTQNERNDAYKKADAFAEENAKLSAQVAKMQAVVDEVVKLCKLGWTDEYQTMKPLRQALAALESV